MYLVEFKEFKEFLKSNNINTDVIIDPPAHPFILQFKRGEKVMGKVEVVNYNAFKWNEKCGEKLFKKSPNKYWIRGAEWTN